MNFQVYSLYVEDSDTEVNNGIQKQFIERRGKIRITHELVERPKRLQIVFVLETGKEIPSSVRPKATPGHTS